MSTDPVEYVMHSPAPTGEAFCGKPMQGPAPVNVPLRIVPCLECVDAPGGVPPELHMDRQIERVRGMLHRKLRGLSEADRAAFRDQVVHIAGASLQDPSWSPALATERDLMAVLYMAAAMYAGLEQTRRTGVRLTYAIARSLIDELSMILIAIAEGLPA